MIFLSKYGYKINLENLESDIYIENKKGKIVAVLTPMEILQLRNKIKKIIDNGFLEKN